MTKNIIKELAINADKLLVKIRKIKEKDKQTERQIKEYEEKKSSDVNPFYYENVMSRILIIFVIIYFTNV